MEKEGKGEEGRAQEELWGRKGSGKEWETEKLGHLKKGMEGGKSRKE